jgi:hypothetical protein
MRTTTFAYPRSVRVELFRGLSTREARGFFDDGIGPNEPALAPGCPSEFALRTWCFPPDLLAELCADEIVEHCERGSSAGGSPWVSWTTSASTARRFALADGRRALGYVARATLKIVRRYVSEAHDRPRDGVFEDDQGRTLIATARYRTLGHDALRPQRMQRLRRIASTELEILVRGRVTYPDAQLLRVR